MKNLGKRIKDNLLNNLKNMRLWEFGAMLLFIVNMAGIFYFNLSDLRLSLDPDFATVVYHLKEIVHKGTLILPDWVATTSMEFDSTLLFAIPLYAITNNAFLAVGLSDLLIVFIYITVIWSILRVLRVRIGIRFLTLAVIITPYNYDWLDYFKMLFFAHANYSIKALIPIMLILCFLAFDKDGYGAYFSRWKRNTFLIIYLTLLFVTSASTGIYSVVCGVSPILFVRILSLWKTNYEYKKGALPVWVLSGAVAATGVFIHSKIYTGETPITPLVKFEDFADNIKEVLIGLFQVFGALITGDVPIYSMMGLFYCLKMFFVLLIIIVAALVIFRWMRAVTDYDLYILFFSIIVFNMLILSFGDMRGGNDFIPYRYLLIGVPTLLMGMGIMLNRYVETHNRLRAATVMLTVILASSYMLVGNFKVTNDNMMDKDYIVDMTDYFKTLDADTVFIMDDKDTALMCKSVDDSKKYACVNSAEENITLEINYYNEEKDFDYYGDKNVIAIPNFNKLSDYVSEKIAGNYRYVGETRWLACYISDTNYFK